MNEQMMNEQEKNASIEYIIAKGLVKPQTARAGIMEMIRRVGFRHIFWDTGYSLCFAALTLAVILVLFAVVPFDYIYSAAVTAAPLGFLLITVFTETSERACGLYELKQTCHYTIRQMTALRVLCYSITGAAFTAVIAALSAANVYEFFALFALCLAALFVFAALSISLMRYLRGKWAGAAYSAAWVFVSVALAFSLRQRWETVLAGVPVVLSAAIAIAGAAVLLWQISRMCLEGKRYVNA